MFDDVLQKAELAMTRLSKVLSAFESDSNRIRQQLDEEMIRFQKTLSHNLAQSSTDNDQIVSTQKDKLQRLLQEHQEALDRITEKSFQDFSSLLKNRFESMYTEYAVEAEIKTLGVFDSDINNILLKNADKLAPVLLKCIFKYVLRVITFKRTKNE